MNIEDREDFVDAVAQAVIDRIEERDRIAGMVEMVVRRVIELQKQETAALNGAGSHDSGEETRRATEMQEANDSGQ